MGDFRETFAFGAGDVGVTSSAKDERGIDDDDEDEDEVATTTAALRGRLRTMEEVLRTLGARAGRLELEARGAREETRVATAKMEDAKRRCERLEADARARQADADEAKRKADETERELVDARRSLAEVERENGRLREERNTAREELKARTASARVAEEDARRRENDLRDALVVEQAKEAERRVEMHELVRRCERAESYGERVSARITEAEREIDAFNEAMTHDADGQARALKERLKASEARCAELEGHLERMKTHTAEVESMRAALVAETPDVAKIRAQLDAMAVRERDLVAALKFEERMKDEAVKEMLRARAAAAKAESFASRCSTKMSNSKALATVIESLGDSLFE
jgi:chromosome segregation ATPase